MHSHNFIDLTGLTFNRLRVIRYAGYDKESHSTRWICICSCGSELAALGSDLRSSHTQSCRCYWRQIAVKHGDTKNGQQTPEYKTWYAMIQRCTNPNAANYRYYGARSIKVCRRWRTSFSNFLADMGQRPSPTHSMHRLRNDRGYCPSNCVWATIWEQNRHLGTTKLTQSKVDAIRRRYNAGGITQAELGQKYGIADTTVSRVISGQRWPNLPPKKPSASVRPARAEAA